MRTTDPDFLNYLKTGNMELTDNLGIPKVRGVRFKNLDSVKLLGFNYCTNMGNLEEQEDALVHFFLPDHYIERVWDNLDHYEAVLKLYRGIIQPDFSMYTDMPKAMQIWQHYRRMWVAQYYQARGIRVIPAPCWSDEDSFEYCFEGMPKGSCLCISTVGCVKNPFVWQAFNKGFQETLDRLKPSQLIIYGVLDDDMRMRMNGIPYVHLESEQKVRIKNYEARMKNS